MKYHVPVLLSECIQGLDIKEGGIYVDVTYGGGGHSNEILKMMKKGRLIAMDQDMEAEKNITHTGDNRFTFIPANFRYLNRYLRSYGISKIDGLLADLGISSYQIDRPERGFSTRFEGNLDMRMDKDNKNSAWEVINNYSKEKLQQIFRKYGEIKNASRLAHTIVSRRINEPVETTEALVDTIRSLAPPRKSNQYLAQVFQAVRIEVNDEIEALKSLLEQSVDLIKKDGRLVVLSYHSLEDRLVKNFINKGAFSGQEEKDLYGNVIKPFQAVNRKPITASEDEVRVNPRSRSAKLRIGKKI